MEILIINGPNLNLLGRREKNIYGEKSFEEYLPLLQARFASHNLRYFQSNSEGAIIDCLHAEAFRSMVSFSMPVHIHTPLLP